MKQSLSAFALCALFCGLLISPAAAFNIAKNGRAQAMIVTGDKPSVVVEGMAKELAKYLQEMTDAEFKVAPKKLGGLGVIRLVIDSSGKMKPESFTIKDVKRTKELVITGADERGLVYGVYGFLERQGCRFWAPKQETIPKKPTLVVPSGYSVTDAPAFTYRNATWSEPCRRSAHFTRKVGLSVLATAARPKELGLDAREDYNHSIGWKRRFLDADRYTKANFKYDLKWYALRLIEPGIAPDVEVVREGEGKTPELRLAEPHHSKYDKGKGGELIRCRIHVCPTNPEMTQLLIKEVREWLRANPTVASVSIASEDNPMICQCARCDAFIKKCGGQYSAVYLNLANQVAYAIKDEFPNVTVRMLAYWMTINPPSNFKGEIAPNLDVCLGFGMYRGPREPNVEDKNAMQTFNNWRKYAPVFVWGYYAHFANFLYPYDDIFNMGADMRGYHERGVRRIYVQLALGQLSDFADLRGWLFGKLSWNPYQDANALIKEWVDGTCGKGAPYIHQYLDLRCQVKVAYQKQKKKGDWKDWDGAAAFKAYQLLQQALEAVKDDPLVFERIEKQSAGILPLIIRPKVYPQFAQAAKTAKVTVPTQAQLIDKLESLFVKYDARWVGENQYAYEPYIKQLRADLEKEQKLK